MKYAILGPFGGILRIIPDKPNTQTNYIEISDEDVLKVTAIKAENKIPILFKGQITSRRDLRESGVIIRWDKDIKDFVEMQRLNIPHVGL